MFEDRLLPWTHVKTEPLLEHPWCLLVEDHVVLPSGLPTTWWRFRDEHHFVSVLCRNEQNQILIRYQYNHPPRHIVDELPGGGVEPTDMNVEAAARRELREETGLYAHIVSVIGLFLPNNRRSASRCIVCLATDFELRTPSPEPTENIAYEWIAHAAIDQHIREGVLQNGMLLAAWSIYRAVSAAQPTP